MKNCPNCQHDNPNNAKFCNNCGNNLQNICAGCSTVNAANSKFCMECGEALEGTLQATQKEDISKKRAAERRQLTILFCDLVGSTPLSEKLDAEEFRQVIIDYHHIAEQVITQQGGHIAQYLGDGLLVYFGYPKGLEDAPKAAVRAGLRIIQAVAQANQQWRKEGKTEIEIRIGIHSGLVIVDEHLALGETVNIAARLEGLAPYNGLVISTNTLNLIKGWFEVKPLGAQALKGISKPMEIFQVLKKSDAKTKLEVAKRRGFSPLVGREGEVNKLENAWNSAKNKKGNVVLLNGEAGIGKSRLIDFMKNIVVEETHGEVLEVRSSAYHQHSAFYPLVELLEKEVLQIESGELGESKLTKLAQFLKETGLEVKTALPLFAEFLSITSDKIAPLMISPIAKRQRLIAGISQLFFQKATIQPLVLIVEDLHWSDESTLEWLAFILPQIPKYPVFLLCTTRPNFKTDWAKYTYCHQLNLQRLSAAAISTICHHQTQGKQLPAAILAQIATKTEGVPLFVEELTKMIMESDFLIEKDNDFEVAGTLNALSIPTTLQDSLLARLDRLSSVREVVQVGAVLGREFSFELLQSVLQKKEGNLLESLTKLVDAEILYPIVRGDQTVYQFKHALIQDTAYDSLLKSRRRQLHQGVADVLKAQFPEIAQLQPELLAHHYTEAGQFIAAIPLWLQAGQQANQAHANAEAIAHLEKGLSLLDYIKNEDNRKNCKLDFLLTLGACYIEYEGYTSLKLETVFNQAKAIAQTMEANEKQAYILFSLIVFYMLSCQNKPTTELIQYTLKLGATQENGSLFTLFGKHLEAFHNLTKGNLQIGNQIYAELIPFYDSANPVPIELTPVGDIKNCMESFWSIILPGAGFLDQAKTITKKHLAYKHHYKDSKTLYHIYVWASWQNLETREWKMAEQIMEQYLPIVHEFGDPMFINAAELAYSNAKAFQGDRLALDKVLEEFERIVNIGVKVSYGHTSSWVADAIYQFGEMEKGIAWIERMLEQVNQSGAHWHTTELYRIQGLCYQSLEKPLEEVEIYFQKAIQLAQKQGAKLYELRAAKNLAELYQGHEKEEIMMAKLQEVYNWFTEGFDSVDLKEVKAILLKEKAIN